MLGMSTIRAVLICILLCLSPFVISSFSPSVVILKFGVSRADISLPRLYAHELQQQYHAIDSTSSGGSSQTLHAHINNDNDTRNTERRAFIQKSAASIVAGVLSSPSLACSADTSLSDSTIHADGNYDCLLDLPPITKGCVRVYLCRHGQTENNRLHLVQGARVDPPINSNGQEQARRLGLALSRLDESTSPHLIVHSKLRRARQTAEVASENVKKKSSLKVYGEIPCLAEVDFGSLDGTEVKDFRKTIRQVSASWSFGDIDKTAGDGGESGREVLSRAGQAIEELTTLATETASSSIVAVSHSAYLRILLSLVADSPLAEAFLWSIQNGGVNVVDINVTEKRRLVTSESGIFGGRLLSRLRKNNRLKLDIPECHLVRTNEVRHLEGMNI